MDEAASAIFGRFKFASRPHVHAVDELESKTQHWDERARELREIATQSTRYENQIENLIRLWDLITYLKSAAKIREAAPGQKSSADFLGLIAPYLSTTRLLDLTPFFPEIGIKAREALSEADTEVVFNQASLTYEQCQELFRAPQQIIRDGQPSLDEGGLFAKAKKLKFEEPIKVDPRCFAELPETVKSLKIENIRFVDPQSGEQGLTLPKSAEREVWDQVIESIATRAPNVETLEIKLREWLNLEEGVNFIAGHMGSLSSLTLRNVGMGHSGANALANGNLQHLRHLVLTHNKMRAEGAREIARGNFSELTSLDISANSIGPEGVQAIANGNLQQLRRLSLAFNKIGAEGIREIARGNFSELTFLNLNYTSINIDHLNGLADGSLSKLTHLLVMGNQIILTRANYIDLRRKLPQLEMLRGDSRKKHIPGV